LEELGFDGRFTVLYVFDASSSVERKNPEGAISAFARAFRAGDRARLLLRATNGHRRCHARRIARLKQRAEESGLDVSFLTAPLSHEDVLRLISACDCYLSLHRAEGFGYTCAEAMAYGRPVVASGYSGTLDYMTTDTARLVACREVPIRVAEGPFRGSMTWADPDVDDAAMQLRDIFENRKEAAAMGERARQSVRRLLAPEVVAQRLSRLLGISADA
jgi:glycosyltransferase involved in cell wall biosynthesis